MRNHTLITVKYTYNNIISNTLILKKVIHKVQNIYTLIMLMDETMLFVIVFLLIVDIKLC